MTQHNSGSDSPPAVGHLCTSLHANGCPRNSQCYLWEDWRTHPEADYLSPDRSLPVRCEGERKTKEVECNKEMKERNNAKEVGQKERKERSEVTKERKEKE